VCSGPRSKYLGMVSLTLGLKADYGLGSVSLVSLVWNN